MECYEGVNKAFEELQKIFGMLGALIRFFMTFKSTDQACVPEDKEQNPGKFIGIICSVFIC